MGATEFSAIAAAKTAVKAFAIAREEALYEEGHGGYTGTIAEKDSFRQVYPRADESPGACIARHEDADTFGDKWGPAGCVEIEKLEDGTKRYMFFGDASC